MFERVKEDDPHRCQAVNAQGQCRNRAVEHEGQNGTYCMAHGGNKQVNSMKKASLNNYRLTKWKAHLERHSGSDQLKSLRDEIGILRMILEEKLNQCNTNLELVMASHQISDLVVKIDKLVTSCHKLEGSMGQLLDKQAILQFAMVVIDIISATLKENPEAIDEISNKILAEIGQIGQ